MTFLESARSSETTPCRSCSTPLAADQRYCLNCGARRGEARVPLDQVIDGVAIDPPAAAAPERQAVPAPAVAATGPDRTSLAVLVIAAIILPAFGLGLLLGGRGDQLTAPAAQVITVGGATPPITASTTTVTDDWPAGKEGWTVQLQTLPKAGTQPPTVQAAIADATAKGAPRAAALDSDAHPSLPAGNYVIFAGVHDDEDEAKAALRGLTERFPAATVVRVGAAAADDGSGSGSGSAGTGPAKSADDATPASPSPKETNPEGLTPEEFRKKSKKLPKTTGTGGKPPPKDNKAPGGGSEDAVTIG